ncbi:MAG: hypothetical protein PHH04_07720 [Thomasclavelia sp.]|nr:hypothetical protein [Thomasclavelia sp.]
MKEKFLNHKTVIIILCIVMILGISGGVFYAFNSGSDEDYTTSVKNGDKSEVYNSSIKITKNDIYKYYLKQAGENEVLNLAMQEIADKEITDKDAINKKVEESKKTYATYADDGKIETYATSNGYSSLDSFVKEALEPDAKQQLLKAKYINKNYKKLLSSLKVKYLKTIECDTESAALNIIKQATSSEKWDELSTANSGSDLGMVTKSTSTLDSKIVKKLSSFTKDGVYKKAIKTSEKKYAVVWVYNTDTSKVKSDIKEALASEDSVSTKYEAYYLKKYDFEVNEDKIKDSIKKSYPSYFE